MTVLSPGDLSTPDSSSRFLSVARKVHRRTNSSSTTDVSLLELNPDNGSERGYSSDSGRLSKFFRNVRLLGRSKSKKISHALPSGSPTDVPVPVITVDTPESTGATIARESETVQVLQPEGNIPLPQPPISNPTGSRDTDQPSALVTSTLRYDIFHADAPKPTVRSPTPKHIRARMESTLQLVFCARLLTEDHRLSTSQSRLTGVCVLDDAGRQWLDAIQDDLSAQARIRWLVSKLVVEFRKDPSPEPEVIFEVVILGPVLCQADYRALLSCFIERFDKSALLNNLLQGMIQLLQSAPSGFLTDDDLVRIVSSLRKRLESTHAPDRAHVYQLVFAISKVLEVMVRGEVKGLNRQRDHQSLLAALRSLNGVEDDEFLKFQVSYAYQMLLYLPDDETSFQAFLRYAESVAVGVSAVGSVFKLDPMGALAAVDHIQQVAGNAIDVVKFSVDGARAFQATAEGAAQAAEMAYWSQKKQPWFLALQAGYLFVQDGRLVDFNTLVCDATRHYDVNFQRGVCQILGEVALNPLWDDGSRRSAIDFLGELFKTDAGRRKDVKVRKWVATILQQISSSTSPEVSSHARTLLDNLQQEHTFDFKEYRALHTLLPMPAVFPLLERALDITDIDHELACIRFRSLEECLRPFSIPLRAKATLPAPEDESPPLMARVQKFLQSDNLVFLLLGDSGSGKSTFCRQLERELWDEHQHSDSGRIPLYINLPSIDDPHCGLIEKYLQQRHDILEPVIREIRHGRQFVLICDGYDESRLFQNLYVSNRRYRPEQWNVKMIITCRSNYLSPEYQGRFYPLGEDNYHDNTSGLFEEATIVPFRESDIQEFVRQYVLNFAAQVPSDNPSASSFDEYWDKLSVIPNLMNLVSNPFLLTLALKALPSRSIEALDSTGLQAMQHNLYDGFIQEWVRVQQGRLERTITKQDIRVAFDNLLADGFAWCVTDYLKRLANAIYQYQDGSPVVMFSRRHKEVWKVEFFGSEIETTLLREASPLTRAGIEYQFIHKSLLDYIYSRTFFDPDDCDDDDSDHGNDGGDDSWGGGDDFHGGGGNSLGDGGNSLADDNGDSAGENKGSTDGNAESTGNNGGSSGGNGGSSGGNGGSTSGNQNSSGGGGNSSAGSGGSSSGGNNDGSRGDKNGSNGGEDGSRRRRDDARSKRKVNTTKSRPSTSSDPFSKRNLFKEPSVLQFLVERAISDSRLRKRLFSAIEQSKVSSAPSMAAANAITILFKSGNLFQDAVLDDVSIPSDYMSTATGSTEPVQLPETGGDLMKVLMTPTIPVSAPTFPATTLAVLPVSAPTVPALMTFSTTIAQTTPAASLWPPRSDDKNRPPSVVSQASNVLSGDNQSNPFSTVEKAILAPLGALRDLETIFDENFPRPTMKTELPQPQQLIKMTQQLVYCNAMLLRDTLSLSKAATGKDTDRAGPLVLQEPALDKAELDWLETTKNDSMEADRLRWLANRVVEQFVTDASKDSTKIADIVALGPVLEKEHYRKLLSTFIKEFDDARILDIDMLQGLIQVVQDTSTGYLVSDDLIKILGILRVHLQGTHQQSTEHSYQLTLAVSRILDVMAEHKVQNLDRVLEHEPLSAVLSGLKDSSDPYLMYQACYAFQALQYVLDDESALQTVWRHSTGVVDGLVKVTAVLKLDLASVLEGLSSLQEALGGTISVTGTVYEGICSLIESGRGFLDSLKKGLGSGQKRLWYPAVKVAYAFAQAGQLKDLKVLIVEATCRRDPLFQWGICQLLGEIAIDPAWSVSARQQSVSLLDHLCEHDQDWGQDESVRAWMLTIITKLCASSDQAISETTRSVLQDLAVDQSALIKHPYPLRARLPLPSASPLLAKVQNIQHIEYDLHKFRLQRLEEAYLPVYIPPMAKANLQARDDDIFPLEEKVQEFLASDRQVMLILGDSGTGKSTFNNHLEFELLHSYNSGDPVPLFINLPALDRPDKDLIGEHMRINKFSEEQIQEMKQYRQFVLICDGYDESQLTVNLHTTNLFNQPGQWNVKMVISCRTQFVGPDYRSRFIPNGTGHYARPAIDLFQEAVIAPFSKEQIENYVERYVPLEPRTWTTKDYLDKLTTIPNLLGLVRNPFLLSLALEALPGVTHGKQELSAIKITRAQLYDTFVDHWLGVNQRRLERNNALSKEDRDILEHLIDDNFVRCGIDYLQKLASAIFREQDGIPVVQYVHRQDKNSWKGEFFGHNPETRMLRESSPLTRTGNLYRFVHRSMLDYFLSCVVFDPSRHDADFDPGSHVVDKKNIPQPGPDPTPTQLLATDGPLFKRNLLSEPSVIQFLCERVWQHPNFERQLLDVIELSKSDASAATAAANAITILVRSGVRFNSADLRGIQIPGADLSDGLFDSAQLQRADLGGVNFARSWLRQADFSNAQLDGVQFEELPYLHEHAPVNAVAFSPDGKLFAVALRDGSLNTYDTTTWNRVRQHKEQSEVVGIAFSPYNQHLAFGSSDGTCRLWDTVNGETLLVMEGHAKRMRSVAFSPCGKQIASASDDSTIRLWSSETGECLFVLNGHEDSVLSVAYSADGRRLVSGSKDWTMQVWDPATGTPEADWVIPRVKSSRVAISADERQFARITGPKRGEIQLVDAITGELGLILNDDATLLTDIAFSPNGKLIVSSSTDRTVRLWDSSSGQLISRLSGHGHWITTCTFSPDGLQIASGDVEGIIQLWEVNTYMSSSNTQELTAEVRTVAFSPDGLFIISDHIDNTIQRWDSSTGASAPIPSSFTIDVHSVALSPNGQWFAGACRDGSIHLWNVRTDVVERILLTSFHYRVVDMRFSRCGRWLVSCHVHGTVLLWDLQSTNDQGRLVGETADLYLWRAYVVFSPVGDQLAIGLASDSSRLRLFDLRMTGLCQPLKEVCLSDRLHSMDYSPDGRRLVLGTDASSVLLWDLQSDKPDVKLEGHTGVVLSVTYSPCGKWILSGSNDTTFQLWSGEVDSWSCVAVVSGCSEAVTSVAWNPVIPFEFASGSDDGSVRVWRLSGAEAGEVSVRMRWSSHIGRLCATDLTFKGAVGLSPLTQRLLVQHGAVDESLPSGEEGSSGEEGFSGEERFSREETEQEE